VQWTRSSATQGYMAARNCWMLDARADYFVSLDDDAWFLQGDEVALAMDCLERNPSVAAIAFDILSPDRPDPKPRGTPRPTATFIGCGHMLRLSALRTVGVYDIPLGAYGGEEKDLCLRLLDADFQTVLLTGTHVWHDKSPLERIFPMQFRSLVCNDLVFTIRRTPAFLLPVAVAVKVVQHFRFAWSRRLMSPCLAGFGLLIGSLGQVWRSRRPVRLSTLRAFMKLSRT
jgi:GT2 family glycosyltransferase